MATTEKRTQLLCVVDIEPDIEGFEASIDDIPLEPLEQLETSETLESLERTRSISNKLNRSAPVLFLKNHGQKMIGKSQSKDKRGDCSWTNWMVGISCCCFLMPSLLILSLRAWNVVRICIIFDSLYFVAVAICSFMSDYVYCWTNKDTCIDFVTLDQWTATGGVVVIILNILVNPYPLVLRIANFICLFGGLYCIGKSRKAMNKYEWRKWHCIWHLYCGITVSILYFQEYLLKTGALLNHL